MEEVEEEVEEEEEEGAPFKQRSEEGSAGNGPDGWPWCCPAAGRSGGEGSDAADSVQRRGREQRCKRET